MMRSLDGRRAVALAVLMFLAGCAKPPMTLPGPIEFQRSPRSEGSEISAGAPAPTRAPQTTVAVMPSVPGAVPAAALPPATAASAAAEPADVSMAIEQTPLPMFIQILYGNVLKRPFSMDPAVSARTDIVTFKTSQAITRSRMEQLAVQLLQSYQVTVQDLDGLIRLVPANSPSAVPPPVLRFGKTLPQTPDALRTAFHYVEIDIVKTSEISQVLRQVLGTRVNIQEDSTRNGLLMSGTQADLRTALELIQSLDQPRMKGRIARRITPAFLNASEFSSRLSDMLTAQGFAVSTSPSGNTPILLVPIPVIGSVMVFANNEASLEHVLRWASELDRPISAQTQNGLFTYAVKYADAQDLAKTLGDILGSPAAAPAAAPQSGAQQAFGAGGTSAGSSFGASTPRVGGGGGRVVVNSATNTLIIRGTNADEYQQLMALLRELDRPVKSALIEVVVAELRLGGTQTLGIDWNVPARSINGGQNLIAGGTLGGVGIGSGGFNLSIGNSVGTILARLNALALDDRARVLSNPKVLARNGETASIQVGAEVPIITSQQSTGTSTGGLFGSTAGVLQQITYRSTGVILRVRPVINSGNRLDLDLSQEVSSAAQTSTGVGASPTISTRRIETKLSLRDGSTVLLGGLISRNQSDSNVGVPFLKDIPGLGSFFRSASNQNDQTELLIMITPYVVSDDFESEAITEAIQNSFGDWARHLKPARVVQQPAAPVPGASQGATPGMPATAQVPAPASDATEASDPSPNQPLVAPSQDVPLRVSPPVAPPRTPTTGATSSTDGASQTTTDGVTISRGAPMAPPAPAAPTGGAGVPPQPSTSGPDLKPALSTTPQTGNTPPPPFVGKPVTDPQIKKELEEFLKNAPRPR